MGKKKLNFIEKIVVSFLKKGMLSGILEKLIEGKIKNESLKDIILFLLQPSDKIVIALLDEEENNEQQIKQILLEHFDSEEGVAVLTSISEL